ncbi:MAG: hypothetical protein AAGC95_11290 [Pseudomonadota bacterium]
MAFGKRREGFIKLYGSVPLEDSRPQKRSDYFAEKDKTLTYTDIYGRMQECLPISNGLNIHRRCFVNAAMQLDRDTILALLKSKEALRHINYQAHKGVTGLHILAAMGVWDLSIAYAKSPGCNLLIRSDVGFRASDFARDSFHEKLAKRLLEMEKRQEQEVLFEKRGLKLLQGGLGQNFEPE